MMITLNPTSDPNKSRRISSSQNGGRVRDVSFSSFLDGNEETFIMKLTESDDISKSHNPNCLASKQSDDNEIGVFTAEKYFYGRVDQEDESHKLDDQNTELELYKSSLNCRSSLLVNNDNPQTTQQSRKSNRWSSSIKCKKMFFPKLGRCSSCCSDKNSVAVNIDVQVARNSSSSGTRPEKDAEFPMKIELQTKPSVRDTGNIIGDSRIEDFRFPVMKSNRVDEQEDAARKSLEVFRSSGLSVERRLKMLTWDGIDMETPSKSSIHDSDSDTSSDLFEIESLSTNPSTSQSQYLTRQTSDAPSVTSTDWSVVTATDAAVKLSDSEEGMRLNSKDYVKTRRNSGILSGCYNNKAVMVAEDAHRTTTTTGDQQVSSTM